MDLSETSSSSRGSAAENNKVDDNSQTLKSPSLIHDLEVMSDKKMMLMIKNSTVTNITQNKTSLLIWATTHWQSTSQSKTQNKNYPRTGCSLQLQITYWNWQTDSAMIEYWFWEIDSAAIAHFGKQILLQLHTNFEKQTDSAANCALILENQTKPAANCTPILEKQTDSAANCSLWLVQTGSAVISTADSSFKHCNLQYHRRCLHSQTVELAGQHSFLRPRHWWRAR